jgi:hypothetical protein
MRNSTLWSTGIIAAGMILAVMLLFFPERAGDIFNAARSFVDPDHVAAAKLEYIATDPARSRGWQALKSFDTSAGCLAALPRDYSKDVTVTAPIGSLRCATYRNNGSLIQVVQTRQP